MSAILSLFSWAPGPLGVILGGGLVIFILYGLFKLVVAIIRVITDLIPGW